MRMSQASEAGNMSQLVSGKTSPIIGSGVLQSCASWVVTRLAGVRGMDGGRAFSFAPKKVANCETFWL